MDNHPRRELESLADEVNQVSYREADKGRGRCHRARPNRGVSRVNWITDFVAGPPFWPPPSSRRTWMVLPPAQVRPVEQVPGVVAVVSASWLATRTPRAARKFGGTQVGDLAPDPRARRNIRPEAPCPAPENFLGLEIEEKTPRKVAMGTLCTTCPETKVRGVIRPKITKETSESK